MHGVPVSDVSHSLSSCQSWLLREGLTGAGVEVHRCWLLSLLLLYCCCTSRMKMSLRPRRADCWKLVRMLDGALSLRQNSVWVVFLLAHALGPISWTPDLYFTWLVSAWIRCLLTRSEGLRYMAFTYYFVFTSHVVPWVEICKYGLSLTVMGMPVLPVFLDTLYRMSSVSFW